MAAVMNEANKQKGGQDRGSKVTQSKQIPTLQGEDEGGRSTSGTGEEDEDLEEVTCGLHGVAL